MTELGKLKKALRRLHGADGRIARRNARRAVFGALRSIRGAVQRDYPAIEKPTGPVDPLAKITGKTWRQVEYRMVKPGRCVWDKAKAEGFNEYLSALDGHPAKPIRFDIHGGRLVGQHTADALRLRAMPPNAKWRDSEHWRTFLHEAAHYRVHGHGRAFKAELLRVYGLWREWMRGQSRRVHGLEVDHE